MPKMKNCAGASGSRVGPSRKQHKMQKQNLRTNTPRKSTSELHFLWILVFPVDLRDVKNIKNGVVSRFCFSSFVASFQVGLEAPNPWVGGQGATPYKASSVECCKKLPRPWLQETALTLSRRERGQIYVAFGKHPAAGVCVCVCSSKRVVFLLGCLFVCLFVRSFVCVFVCLFICVSLCFFGWLAVFV